MTNNDMQVIVELIKKFTDEIKSDFNDFKKELQKDFRQLENKIDKVAESNNKNAIGVATLSTKYQERVTNCDNRFKSLHQEIEANKNYNKDMFGRIMSVISSILSLGTLLFVILKLLKGM